MGDLQWQVINNIDQLLKRSEEGVILIAIDGKCGSGKTTLSEILKEHYFKKYNIKKQSIVLKG